MKRLYFLAPDLESVDAISRDLHASGVTDYNFHVVAKDEQGMRRHHIHQASPLLRLDIIHSGEIGAMIGLVSGFFIAGLFMKAMEGLSYFGPWHFLAVMVLVTLFGSWAGGLAGASHDNYKIARFHDAIEDGFFLIMIDVDKKLQSVVEKVMAEHTEAMPKGDGVSWNNPFEGIPSLSDEHGR